MTLLLLRGVDPTYPTLLGVLYRGRPEASLAPPGLRLDPGRHLVSWDRHSGLGWAGIGAGGLIAGLAPCPGEWTSRIPDILGRALAGTDPAGAARALHLEWGEQHPVRGWLVVAGAGQAWLVAGGMRAASELMAGVHLFLPGQGPVSAPWPGQAELAQPGLSRWARQDAILAILEASAVGEPVPSAALIGIAPGGLRESLFLYRPVGPAGASWLDYSNLLERLET